MHYYTNYYDNLRNNIKDISRKCGWGDYYSALGLPGGVCFGMSAMWGQAYLANDLKTFYKRLDFLTVCYSREDPISKFICKAIDIEKSRKDQTIYFNKKASFIKSTGSSKGLEIFLSIRGFLDGLLAYHNPVKTVLMNNGQNVLESSKYVISQSLTSENNSNEAMYGLKNIYKKPFIGDKKDYFKFISILVDALNQVDFNSYIQLRSFNHAVSFSKDLKFYDINDLSRFKIKAKDCKDIRDLVESVFEAFSFNLEKKKFLVLEVEVFVAPGTDITEFDSLYVFCYIRYQTIIRLNDYISKLGVKHHRDRAIHTRQEIQKNDKKSFVEFINEEVLILKKEVQNTTLNQNHYKSNKQSLSKFTEKSQYYQILKNALEALDKKNVCEVDIYKKIFLEKILKKRYFVKTKFGYIVCRIGEEEIISPFFNSAGVQDNSSIALYFIGGVVSENIKVLDELKYCFPYHDINSAWGMPQKSGMTKPMTPLMQSCIAFYNDIILWLLDTYEALYDTKVFCGKDALEWYKTHKNKDKYSVEIENRLERLYRH